MKDTDRIQESKRSSQEYKNRIFQPHTPLWPKGWFALVLSLVYFILIHKNVMLFAY